MRWLAGAGVWAVLAGIGWIWEKADPPNSNGDRCPIGMSVGETKWIDGEQFECMSASDYAEATKAEVGSGSTGANLPNDFGSQFGDE